MKKRITFLMAALLLLSGLTWAQSDYSTTYTSGVALSTAGGTSASTCTVNISNNGYDGLKAGTGKVAGAVKITVPANTKYFHMHIAAWNNENVTLAITPSGYSENIALTSNSGIANNSPFTFNGDPSTSDYYKVITFASALTDDTELTFTATGGKRFVVWGVNAEEEGSVTAPSITASNVQIDYNVTSGAIEYSINNEPTPAGTLTAVTDSEWLTVGTVGATVPFTCGRNPNAAARFATVVLTYTYNTNETVTKNVTVTQNGNPNIVNSISEITATGSYSVQGTIVAKSSRGFIVGDGTGYVYYYNQNYTQADYNIGDKVKLSGAVTVYGGVYQFTSSASITSVETSNYVAEDPTVLTGEDMDARVANTTPPQLSNYIQYSGTLTIDGTHYNITGIDGAQTAIGSISYPLNTTEITALQDKQVTVTGYYVGISSSTYYNTMLGSIEEIITNDPSITANNVELPYDATEGVIEYTINNPANDGVLTAATTSNWLTVGTVDETIPLYCDPNTEAASRTATVTLTYTYGRTTTTKEVTVTQAGNPDIINNISDITATGSYTVQGTIVAKSTRGFIVGDGTGYVYYYNQNYTQADYNIGDMVKLAGSVVAYGGVFEFNSSATVTTATESNYEEEEPIVISGSEMDTRVGSSDDQLSSYVQYEGTLSVSGTYYNITNIEGATTAKGSISYPLVTEFTSLNGKTVIVKGFFVGVSNNTYYNTMLGTIEEVVVTEPSVNIANATVNVTAEGGEGTLTVTYNNFSEILADVDYCDAEGISAEYDWFIVEINDENNVEYIIDANEGEARTGYFRVFAFDDEFNEVYSNIVTINQAEYVIPALDYAELPFEFDGGRADIESTDGLSHEGLDSDYGSSPKLKFNTTGDWLLLHFLERPGELSFDIKGNSFSDGTFTVQTSEDGETYTDLAEYAELGATVHEVFNTLDENVRYIKWIYTEKVNGNVALGNIVLTEYTEPVLVATITVDPATVEATAAETEGTLTVTYENITEITAEVYFCDAEGEAATYDWITADINNENNVEYIIDANEGEARTAYLKVYALDDNAEDVYSNLVTINQAAPLTGATYTMVSNIESGKHYIITNGNDKALGGQNNNNRAAVEITTVAGVAYVNSEDVCEVVINGPDANGFYTIYDAATPGYLYAAGGTSSNHLKTETFCDNRGQWTIAFDGDNNAASIVANFEGRNTMRYNSSNDIFSCYSGGQQPVYLYVKDDDTSYEFYTDIAGYNGGDGGYYLIASPIDGVNPADIPGMIAEPAANYDLYAFDQAEEQEWRNYKSENFNLAAGAGYLYANNDNLTLKFEGTPANNGDVVLYYTAGGDFPGWNLVGNPFGQAAYIDRPFYIMNAEGTEFISNEGAINPMQGIFVVTETNEETMTFSTEAPAGFDGKVVLNVTKSRGNLIDRAMIRFGEGRQLPKFMLNPANTNISIAQDNNDYAVVRGESQGEMPVNFKVSENGTYTINVNTENVDMDYLHLIDNKTGMDVDLLATPSYTFEANISDYASRFRMVFGITTDVNDASTNKFAIYSNGNLYITNEGNATLQVVDMLGRVISSQNINGSEHVSINANSGVYMIQLIQGNNIKTQKIVVE